MVGPNFENHDIPDSFADVEVPVVDVPHVQEGLARGAKLAPLFEDDFDKNRAEDDGMIPPAKIDQEGEK